MLHANLTVRCLHAIYRRPLAVGAVLTALAVGTAFMLPLNSARADDFNARGPHQVRTLVLPEGIPSELPQTRTALRAPRRKSGCPQHYALGQPPLVTNASLESKTAEVCFEAYGVMHSGVSRTPLCSAEHLTAQTVYQAQRLPRFDSFHPELSLPADQRAELFDFKGSGLDRGHMTPNGDAPTPSAQQETFSLANVVPQDPYSNRFEWEAIEAAVRRLAKERGELYVITGPLFLGTNLRRLNDRVLVPSHLFKVVYDPRRGEGAAYVMANIHTKEYQVVSIADIEQHAGINFFPHMRPDVKNAAMALPTPTLHHESQR